jgi:hypothetical protein
VLDVEHLEVGAVGNRKRFLDSRTTAGCGFIALLEGSLLQHGDGVDRHADPALQQQRTEHE